MDSFLHVQCMSFSENTIMFPCVNMPVIVVGGWCKQKHYMAEYMWKLTIIICQQE